MYDDDGSRYYFQQRQRIIETVIQRAVSGGNDTISRDLRRMLGLDRRRTTNGTGDSTAQQEGHKDAPRT